VAYTPPHPPTTFVGNCWRCGAKNMTLEITSDTYLYTHYEWQNFFEVCCLCRSCKKFSLKRFALFDIKFRKDFYTTGSLTGFGKDLTSIFVCQSDINLSDIETRPSPEALPEDIAAAFNEGTKCLSINCTNAASTMFRLCLDKATKNLLPDDGVDNGPNGHQRRNLAPRLKWLFENNLLPKDLEDLSHIVKDHGDEGAHDGLLTAVDADDIYDFAYLLLERLFRVQTQSDG